MGAVTTFGGERQVFAREYGARLYSLPAYFWSRFVVDLPFRITLPFISANISYWMIGFQVRDRPCQSWPGPTARLLLQFISAAHLLGEDRLS
jgi:hypothetical protein